MSMPISLPTSCKHTYSAMPSITTYRKKVAHPSTFTCRRILIGQRNPAGPRNSLRR